MSTARVQGAGFSFRGLFSRALPWLAIGVVAWTVLSEVLTAPALSTGEPAPALSVTLSTGEAFALAAARGNTVVLNFWATYCEPCRREAPALARVNEALRASGGRVIGVSVDRAALAQVTPIATRLGMSYPIGMASYETTQKYKVERVPTTYVIGPTGMIRRSFVGAVDEEELLAAARSAR